MADQKIENLLNLAAGSTNSEKEKSENLGVGFDPQTDTWEIIVKYTGDILSLANRYPGIRIVPLLGQYAIVTIAEDQLDDFSDEEVITYIEKSKQLVFTVVQGRIASCINPVQAPPLQLTGKGVLTAVIDSGIDYTEISEIPMEQRGFMHCGIRQLRECRRKDMTGVHCIQKRISIMRWRQKQRKKESG